MVCKCLCITSYIFIQRMQSKADCDDNDAALSPLDSHLSFKFRISSFRFALPFTGASLFWSSFLRKISDRRIYLLRFLPGTHSLTVMNTSDVPCSFITLPLVSAYIFRKTIRKQNLLTLSSAKLLYVLFLSSGYSIAWITRFVNSFF